MGWLLRFLDFFPTIFHLQANIIRLYSFWYVFDRLFFVHFGGLKLLEQNFFRSVRRTGGSESCDGLSADRAQGDGGTGSELYDRTK